jgi:hypothetical protein
MTVSASSKLAPKRTAIGGKNRLLLHVFVLHACTCIVCPFQTEITSVSWMDKLVH